MKLRRKVTLAFFLISTLVCVVIAGVLYRFIKRELETELRGRLGDIAEIGAHSIHLAGYERLIARLTDKPTDELVSAVEHSDDYKAASDQLNVLRNAEPTLVRYAYLLAPGADPDHPRFVVDADVLALLARNARGDAATGSASDDNISHFDEPYDVSKLPVLRQAIETCTPQFEPDFVWDEEFKVSSVSAYWPLGGTAGHCKGVIGVDVTDTNMRAVLSEGSSLALKISAIVIALALLVSIAMGSFLTKPIIALTAVVKRFANKDFAARTELKARDEIGELGTNFNDMAGTIQVHSDHLEDLVAQRTSELVAEKQTSERLLLNVLPAPIADRLKHGENLIVDRFESVSVLFADIVGFTKLSARTTPEALVTMLNDLFSSFDKLAETHALEKIKTIGDAYMVVAGIPQPIADHAVAIAHMALDMIAAIDEYAARSKTDLTIRVGIHTGSVVAGVIGTKKFIYDLWGDTVNTASRMESHGMPGRVHVSEATADQLRHVFELTAREPMEVKGKGTMQTYLLGPPLAHDPNAPTEIAIKLPD